MTSTNKVLHIYCGKIIVSDDAAGFVTNHKVGANDFVFAHGFPFLGVNIDVEFAGDKSGVTDCEWTNGNHFVNNKR